MPLHFERRELSMKRMLFNATQSEELRVAIVDGQKLIDLDIESAGREQRKSNIYKGVVTRVEPSLEAAFVNYGTDRHGFLPFKEISRVYFQGDTDAFKARIQDVIKEGLELIVQVDKDERGNKGAALTTYISLAGRYLVLMPNNPRGGGVSRRIEGEDRNELRDTMAQLELPQGMSIIARTAGIGRTVEELQWDLNYLIQLWTAVENASTIQAGAFLIYQEGSLVIRAIRDYFQPDIGEILIDTSDIYEQAVQFMNHVMPNNVAKVKLYEDPTPLFSRFQIEHQIETAFAREVRLPSGGAIVIDHTEALVSIDVNSGRSTKGSDIENTAFNTNLEAAEEVARQLRLRDIGGLVVIDFIDMENQRNQRDVENRLRDALHYDRARVQTGKISRFGLLELSRQRLRPSLGEGNHIPCPRCHGIGHIRGIESTALHILRITQEEAMKENSKTIQVQLPVEAATFLLNEKRSDIHKIEQRTGVEIILIPNIHLETPNYSIVRIKTDDSKDEGPRSYELVEMPTEDEVAAASQQPATALQPAVKGITPVAPAPAPAAVAEKSSGSIFSKLKKTIQGLFAKEEEQKSDANDRDGRNRRDRNRRSRNGRNRGERGDRPQRPDSQHQARDNRSAFNNAKPEQAKPAQQAAIVEPDLANSQQETRETREPRGNRRNRNRRDRNRQNRAQDNTGTEINGANPVAQPNPDSVKEKAIAPTPAVEIVDSKPTAQVEVPTPVVAEKNETPAKKGRSKPETSVSDAKSTVEADQTELKTEKKKAKAPARKPTKAKTEASSLQLVETKTEAKQSMIVEAPEEPAKKTKKTAAWQKKQVDSSSSEPLTIVQTSKQE
jgi:ribonuclease E